MKNPFVMMATLMAAMSAAFRENAYRNAGMNVPGASGRSRIPGKKNPAGTKKLVRFYKTKHGMKPESVEQARAWYRAYLAEQDAKARGLEARRRAAREALTA